MSTFTTLPPTDEAAAARTDPVTLVLQAVSTRWTGLTAHDYSWAIEWAKKQLTESTVDELVDAITSHQEAGLPAAAEMARVASHLANEQPVDPTYSASRTRTPLPAAPAVTHLPDVAPNRGSVQTQADAAAELEEASARAEAKGWPRQATVFVSHELINSKCSDDAVALWLLLGQAPGSDKRYVMCEQDFLLATLGLDEDETGRRRLRRARENLELHGGVKTRLIRNNKGHVHQVWFRQMVPKSHHGPRFEMVASERTAAVLARYGVKALRIWLRYAAAAAGTGSTELTADSLASRWNVTPITVKRWRRDAKAAGLIEDLSGNRGAAHTGVLATHEVIHKATKNVRTPVSNLSGGQYQICPHKEQDNYKTTENPLVASATSETLQRASHDPGRPGPPSKDSSPTASSPLPAAATRKGRRGKPPTRADKIVARVPELSRLTEQQRGICRSRLIKLLKNYPHLDDSAIQAALRTRFDNPSPDGGQDGLHSTMVTDAVRCVVADTIAAPPPAFHPRPHRPVPEAGAGERDLSTPPKLIFLDPATAAAAASDKAKARLAELADADVPELNLKDLDADPYRWLVKLCAVHASRSPTPQFAIDAIVRRARRRLRDHPEHHAAITAAAALVSRIAEPIQITEPVTLETSQP